MARNEPQINLRIAPELKTSLVNAAVHANRSLTSEITARLRVSFETPAALPFFVQQAIEHEKEERGGTTEEAHIRVALAALAQGGKILAVTLAPGTTYKEFSDLLKAGETIVTPNTSIVFKHKSVK